MRRLIALGIAAVLVLGLLLATAWRPFSGSGLSSPQDAGIQRDADNLSGSPTPAPAHGVPTASSRPAQTPPAHEARPGTQATPTPSTKRPASRTRSGAGTAPARADYLVVFVLDGAKPDYLSVSGIPNIRALMRSGTRFTNAWASILESETPSGHAALTTGSPPRQDGVLSFDWAGNDNITVDLFDPEKVRKGELERQMGNATSIAELVHHHDRHARVVALSGHKYYAADAVGGPDADAIMYYQGMPNGQFAPVGMPGHMPPKGVLTAPGLVAKSTHLPMGVEDHLTMRLASASFKKMRPRVLLVNVPEFDWPLGHPDGADLDPAGVRLLMRGFDRDLGKFMAMYRQAGILNRTLFVVTADHGFAGIAHKVDKDPIDKAIQKAGTDVISDTYHTAAYVWVKDESRARVAAANVARLQTPGIQSVYYREVAPSGPHYIRATGEDLFHVPGVESANQYLLNTFNGPNGPDIVVFFTENTASLPGGEATWKGDHGGADWESQHIPLIISGPGVHRGRVSGYPARLEDIAPTVLTLMGITPRGMLGVPVADAMAAPTSVQIQASRTLGATLSPLVTALKSESHAEIQAGQ